MIVNASLATLSSGQTKAQFSLRAQAVFHFPYVHDVNFSFLCGALCVAALIATSLRSWDLTTKPRARASLRATSPRLILKLAGEMLFDARIRTIA
jgi:hypothetical protein